jgi:hypothetical protein
VEVGVGHRATDEAHAHGVSLEMKAGEHLRRVSTR